MPLYEFEMLETRTVRSVYTIRADNEFKARELALKGETVFEEELKSEEVINREILLPLGEVEDDE